MTKRPVYHVLEQFSDKIARQSYFLKLHEAEKEAVRLQNFFDQSFFYVVVTDSKNEPFEVNC